MEKMLAKRVAQDHVAYNNWLSFISTFDVDILKSGYITGATFELTAFCTLKCPMCYVRINKDRADSLGGRPCTGDQWIELARQFRDQGGIFLLITGGEAMAHPEFPRIYSEISKMGLLISLFTNGTTVDDKILELLKSRPPAMLGITIYGSSEETYKKFGGCNGSFKKAMDGLDRLLTIPNLAIDVRFTACSENYKDFKTVYELALQRNKMISLDFGSSAPTRGAHSDARKLRLTKEQINELKDILEDVNRTYSEEYNKLNMDLGYSCEDASEAFTESNPNDRNRGLRCKGGKNNVYIAWDGRMYPCDMASYPYSFPLQIGFKEAAMDIRHQIDALIQPKKCTSCANKNIYCRCLPKALNEMNDCARAGELCNYTPILD